MSVLCTFYITTIFSITILILIIFKEWRVKILAKYHITVYGREQICASCVGAPGSKETYEWLQAAIRRKYDENDFEYEYVDMDESQSDNKHIKMIERMEEEDMFFPLVLLNDEIIAEGVPHLKKIFQAIEAVND